MRSTETSTSTAIASGTSGSWASAATASIPDPNVGDNASSFVTTVRSGITCDIDGDGLEDIVTGAGSGGGPHVRAFSLANGTVTELAR